MTRLLTKKMRDSFNCETQIEPFGDEFIFRWSRLYDTEKQRILTLKRVVK